MNATAVTLKKQHALTFNAHEIKTITRDGQLWMSSSQLRQALDYVDEKAVHRIYASHADEFTATMTKVIKVATAGGRQAVRFFSLRGAHLLAMFARTPVAKAFRAWVLDILDHEVAELKAQAAKGERLSAEHRREVERLCMHTENLRSWWEWIYPALYALNRTMVGAVHDHFTSAAICSRILTRELKLDSDREYAACFPWGGSYADQIAYHLNSRGAA